MIRPAKLEDIPYLLEIEKLSFLPHDRFCRNQFWYAIHKGKGALLVDYEFKTIYRGYIYILNNGRIYSLAIHPSYIGKGVGKELLTHAERICCLLPKVILEVRGDNINGRLFYVKNGYKATGIKHNYYADGMDAILMEKEFKNAKR